MEEFEAREWMKGFSFGIGDEESFPVKKMGTIKSESEILEMLEEVRERLDFYRLEFTRYRKSRNREAMLNAARNHKALEGVQQALRWVLSQEEVDHPLY